jgi:N-acetylneuraminate synthase/N,N'-diacetyllegionaminate synthase
LQIKIGDKLIGNGFPCFIIAEAGVNHDGDIEKARKLIEIAKDANVDAIKFQTWITEEIVTKSVETAKYQQTNMGKKESQFEMIKRLELSYDQFRDLKKYADKHKIIFLSTPADVKSVDFLEEIEIPAYKISSGDLTNGLLLKKVAKKDKPIILSTGMANLHEIEKAIKIIYDSGNNELILLHCTSQYPTEYKDANLRAMITLKNSFNNIVGYSDHTIGTLVPQLAVGLGAKVIEKHFTYNKHAIGPDHICSLDPVELKDLVKEIRTVELILGKSNKEPTKEELELRKIIRKTVVAKINIPKGSKITEEMLTVKRSKGTIESEEISDLIGKVALKNIKKDQPINKIDLN